MSLHESYLRALTYWPPVRSRLHSVIDRFVPILESAFQEDRYAQLLTLFCLDNAERGKLPAAKKLLTKLEPIAFAGSDAEKALWFVAAGYYLEHCDRRDAAVSAYEDAAAFDHYYAPPYFVMAEFHLMNTRFYDLALENYDRAINCVYHYPPLTEDKLSLIAMGQAGMAICLAMMHRTEEAASALKKAASASDTEEYFHATALLCALDGDADGAQKALDAFHELNPELADHIAWHIRMILDQTHIHFFPRPATPGLPEDFWAWFREKEAEFQPLLDKGDADACGSLLAEHINTIVPDEEDMMTATISLRDGQPTIILTGCYSRTYVAMIAAIASACPPDIAARWRIIQEP